MSNPLDNDLLRYKQYNYVVLDTETCSLQLSPQHNFPWALGYIVVENGQTIKEVDAYIWKDNLKIGADAARITRFSPELYKRRARPAKEVYDDFAKYYYDDSYLKIGTNTYYDWHMIKCLEYHLGIKDTPDNNHLIYCTHALSKALKLNLTPPKNKEEFIIFQFALLNIVRKGLKTGIKAMVEHFQIPYSEADHHGALSDCHYTNAIWKKLIWSMEIY